jgi:hypothetical protein
MDAGGEKREAGLADILRSVWPDTEPAAVTIEKISHRRNADHWRIQLGTDTLVIRSTKLEDSARRIVAALDALAGAPFAPALRTSLRRDDGTFLIAMEDLGETAPTSADTQSMLPQFVDIIKRLHDHAAFGEAVVVVGRGDGEDSSLAWAEEEWALLKEIAPDDVRLAPAIEWMEIARESMTRAAEAQSIMVSGHGDLHNENWRRGPRGLALIDWEEIRRWPLASELADFVVFGGVDPIEVTRLCGAPLSYAECIRREAASCALSFYLHWLRTMIDGSDTRLASFQHVRAACERLFRSM